MYGHRRMFIVGAAIFGVGSFLASVSHSVPTLVFGEAIIEGIGASLLIPATLSILSTTFEGANARSRSRPGARSRARRSRSARWSAVSSPRSYSWRWALRINVIAAPLFLIGALLLMRPDRRAGRRPRHRRARRAR